MKTLRRCFVVAGVALCLAGCHEYFNNVVDPFAEDYQGYDTVRDPSEIGVVYPANSEFIATGAGVELLVTAVSTAAEYGVQLSLTSSLFDDGIVLELTSSSNRLTVPAAMAFPGLFSWRAHARATGEEWGVWSGQGQYYVVSCGPEISGWTYVTSLPASRYYFSSAVTGGHVYVIGGYGGSESYVADVLHAAVNADGTLGSWQSATSLPSGRGYHGSVVTGGHVYVIGGSDGAGSYVADVLYAPVNTDGSLGTWRIARSLPSGRYNHSCATFDGYVYVIGGYGDSGSLADVLCASVNPDGSLGSWQSATGLPSARYEHSSAALDGYVYVIGGYGGSGPLADVLYAEVSAEGSLGSWQSAASLPSALCEQSSVVSGGYVYVLGGYDGSSWRSEVLYGEVDASGYVSSWATTSGGTWGEFNAHTSVASGPYVYALQSSSVYVGSLALQSYGSPVLPDVVVESDGRWIEDGLDITIGDPVDNASIRYTTDGTTPTPDHGNELANGGSLVLTEPCTLKAVAYMPGIATSEVLSTTYHKRVALPAFSPASGVLSGSVEVSLSTTTSDASIYYTLGIGTPDTPYTGLFTLATQTTVSAVAHRDGYVDSDIIVKTYGPEGAAGLWRETTGLPLGRQGHGSVEHEGFVYVIGGYNDYWGNLAGVVYAEVNTDGSLGSWQSTTSLPSVRDNPACVASGGYVYVLGGSTSGYLADVLYAEQNEDGSLGSWQSATSLPSGRCHLAAAVSGGFVYAIGGYDGSSSIAEVLYAMVGIDGSLGSWQSATGLPSGRYDHAGVADGGYLYVIGGAGDPTVLYAAVNGDGSLGSWLSAADLPSGRYGLSSVALAGYLYAVGGYDGSYLPDVLYASVEIDGSLGSWQSTTSLISGRYQHSSVVSGGSLFVLGGYDGSSDLSEVLVADLVVE